MIVAIPFLLVFGALVGLAFISIAPGFSDGLTRGLKSSLGPLGYALAIGPLLVVKMTRYLSRYIGEAILSATAATVGWLASLAKAVEYVAVSALLWPVTMTRVFFWLLDIEIPRLIHALPNAATRVYRSTVVRVVRIERTVVRFTKLSRAQVKAAIAAALGGVVLPYLPSLRWLKAHIHALTAVVPHAIPLQWGRTISGIRKRLRRLERLGAAGLAVGAVAAALARLGVGWIRCRKVGRVGRQLCGMDDSFLESLLLDAAAIFSLVSVVEFATELRAVEDEALAIMGKLVREWPG